jgi:hypothetical protein
MTYDRYGHLFPRGGDAKELDAAERALLQCQKQKSRRGNALASVADRREDE